MADNVIISYLEKLGLSEIEAKLYLTLLRSGPIAIRDLAKRIGLKRTTAYLYIDLLAEKGLVTKFAKQIGTQKVVAAENPEESINSLISKKTQAVEDMKKDFPSVMQELKKNTASLEGIDNFEIKYIKGFPALEKIYEAALEASEVRSYVILYEHDKIFPDAVTVFKEAFRKNLSLKMKEIIYDTPFVREEIKKYLAISNRYACKFMPKQMRFAAEDMLIFDDKVAIMHIKNKKEIAGVVIKSKDFYDNSKSLFDYIWDTIK